MYIYTAAMYSMMQYLRDEVCPILKSDGHVLTARWVTGAEETLAEGQAGAVMDIEDINKSDCLMLFTNKRGTMYKGGGRHVEFGYAYGRMLWDTRADDVTRRRMRRIVVVGDYEHIFCHLPEVEVFGTLAMARGALGRVGP